MLMELLYENASARPDDVAIVYRDERVTHGDLVERVERLAAGPGRPGHRAGGRRGAAAAERSLVHRELLRDHGARGRRRAGQPRLQAGRARLLLPPVRGAGRDQRRAQRRRMRAHRGRLGAAGAGDHHELGARAGAHARHADGARAGEARAALAGRGARLPVLLGLHGPAQARGPHPRPVLRRGRVLPRDGNRAERPDLLRDPALPHLRHGLLHVRGRRQRRHAGDPRGPESVPAAPPARARAARAGEGARSSRASRSTSG